VFDKRQSKPRALKPHTPVKETLYHDSDTYFTALIDAINHAQQRVDLEVYIYEADALGNRIQQALEKAASRGVEVRVIVDGAGINTDFSAVAQETLRNDLKEVPELQHVELWQRLADDFTDVEGGLRYRLMIDPLSNLLAHCAKYGKPLAAEEVYITEIPTSRCIVNAVGAGVEHLFVPKKYQALYGKTNAATRKANLSRKTSYALKALSILEDKGAVKVIFKDF